MQNILKMPEFDLQLFNGAAAGAAAGGEGASGGGVQGTEGALSKADTNRRSGGSRRSRSGEYANVIFGKQDAAQTGSATDPAAGGNGEGNANKSGFSTTSDALEAKRKAFADLVDGEYKDQFTERTQQIINRRFKEVKGLEDSLSAQKPILDMLLQRYGISDGDMKKLQTAIEEDTGYWQEAADQAGMTVEQYKNLKKLERENAEFLRERQRQAGEQQAQQQFQKWMHEAEGMKGLYTGFDLRAELANPEFQKLLKAGISMQQTYELIHMDEIKAAAAKNAAQATSKQMQANIKAKASRPSENGTSSNSAAIVKNDVHSLSKADRAEAVRRALMGEKISF